MAAGSCKVDPPTGIAGLIYSGWISDADAGLASGVTVSSGRMRRLLGAQVEAIATAIFNATSGLGTGGTLTSGHLLGSGVTWTSGTGPGQYQFGAACPNGTMQTIVGSDTAGQFTINAGINTATGPVVTLYYAVPFDKAPFGNRSAMNSGSASIEFGRPFYVSTTKSGWTLNTNASMGNFSGLAWGYHSEGYT